MNVFLPPEGDNTECNFDLRCTKLTQIAPFRHTRLPLHDCINLCNMLLTVFSLNMFQMDALLKILRFSPARNFYNCLLCHFIKRYSARSWIEIDALYSKNWACERRTRLFLCVECS